MVRFTGRPCLKLQGKSLFVYWVIRLFGKGIDQLASSIQLITSVSNFPRSSALEDLDVQKAIVCKENEKEESTR